MKDVYHFRLISCLMRSLGPVTVLLLTVGLMEKGVAGEENVAQKAYELRIDGKVDEAKALLDKHLADKPDDAAAYYELARTNYYMGTGKPENQVNYLENAQKAITKAMEIESDNAAYRFFAARVTFLESHAALQSDWQNAKEHIGKVCDAYEAVLKLKPDYGVALLHLVELYSGFSEEMGGDMVKAEQYTAQLEKHDPILGAQARAMILPKEADAAEFWRKIVDRNPGDAAALEELGKVYLRRGQAEEGARYIEMAIDADPDKSILLLEIARYHKSRPLAEEAINKYLESDPIPSIKAYAMGLLARFSLVGGDENQSNKRLAEAEAIDPYYSKSLAIPDPDLFIAPSEMPRNHDYLFQPF